MRKLVLLLVSLRSCCFRLLRRLLPFTRQSLSEKTRTVTLTLGATVVKPVIGSKTFYVSGQPKQMNVVPVILKKGRTYLPVRWVAEAFGYEVGWDAVAKTILVGPPGQLPKPKPKSPVSLTYKGGFNLAF